MKTKLCHALCGTTLMGLFFSNVALADDYYVAIATTTRVGQVLPVGVKVGYTVDWSDVSLSDARRRAERRCLKAYGTKCTSTTVSNRGDCVALIMGSWIDDFAPGTTQSRNFETTGPDKEQVGNRAFADCKDRIHLRKRPGTVLNWQCRPQTRMCPSNVTPEVRAELAAEKRIRPGQTGALVVSRNATDLQAIEALHNLEASCGEKYRSAFSEQDHGRFYCLDAFARHCALKKGHNQQQLDALRHDFEALRALGGESRCPYFGVLGGTYNENQTISEMPASGIEKKQAGPVTKERTRPTCADGDRVPIAVAEGKKSGCPPERWCQWNACRSRECRRRYPECQPGVLQ